VKYLATFMVGFNLAAAPLYVVGVTSSWVALIGVTGMFFFRAAYEEAVQRERPE
jgi:hypothetical protein